ncbi:MAG: hypothetical protein JNJ54_24135 [Myxococcaceae bacterium]|nr:hypothetical protein [Myxococcaceae bacterium]
MRALLRARHDALAPRAVVGQGVVAKTLAARLLVLPEPQRRQLRVVSVDQLVIAVGPEDALPWVDGARYLGAEPHAPGMLIPTLSETEPAAPLVERALRRAHALPEGPFAVLSLSTLVPLARATPISRAALAGQLGEPDR